MFRKSVVVACCTIIIFLSILACGASSTATSQPTPAPTVPKNIVWSQGAIKTFHSSDYPNTAGISNPFTVPNIWRITWFCFPSNDPTQSFFSVDVQHAGDMSNADGENEVKTLDCGQNGHGFTIEQIPGSVTIQIVAGTGVKWDVYIQIPK